MTGKCLQVFRLTKYPGRKWYRWVLVYPPQREPHKSKDLPTFYKAKRQLYELMAQFVVPDVPDWLPTQYKIIHPCGRSCLRVVWRGRVWRDGKISLEPGRGSDLLGEPPFLLK